MCIEVIGNSLLQYESFEGVPLIVRQRVLAYLQEMDILLPSHLTLLLNSEFTHLDLSRTAQSASSGRIDYDLTSVGGRCPNLRNIELKGCRDLHEASFQALAQCHSLTRISLDDCVKLSDSTVSALVFGCPLITYFSAQNCLLLTEASLLYLGTSLSHFFTGAMRIFVLCDKIHFIYHRQKMHRSYNSNS